MTDSAFITGIFPYIAVAFFLLGSAWRFVRWLSLPPHLKWTLYPVPEGLAGQLRYMAKEMFTFETLYKFNRRLWFGSFCMHMAMVGAVLFFILYLSGWSTKFVVQVCLSVIAIAAVYIIGLRIYDKNLRLLSNFEEFFNLAFLAGVAAAGVLLGLGGIPARRLIPLYDPCPGRVSGGTFLDVSAVEQNDPLRFQVLHLSPYQLAERMTADKI